MARTLVAGGCGLFGAAVAQRLLEQGEEVVACDHLADTGDGRHVKEWRADRLKERGAVFVRVDLSVPEALWPVFADNRPAAIVNAALFAPDGPGVRPLATVARMAGIGFLVHLSDAALYGPPPQPGQRAREDEPLGEPTDPTLKLRKEEEAFLAEAGLPYAILRIFPLLGSGFPPGRFPGRDLETLLSGDEIVLEDDEPRDFVPIDDAARAVQLALRTRPAGAILNVGSGLEVRPSDVLQALAVRCGHPLRLRVEEGPRPVYRVADTVAAWERLQFATQHGIGDVVEAIAADRFSAETTTSRPRRPAPEPAAERAAEPSEPPRAVSRRELFGVFRRPFSKTPPFGPGR